MKLAIALLTKNRPEQTKRSIEPLLQFDKFDLYWVDGSTKREGCSLQWEYADVDLHGYIRGGPDAAIVYALTTMLTYEYTHIGVVEQDVLLDPDWFTPTTALFERGAVEGLSVGAVSARSYQDRILIQRDGYAVMHNLGSGMVIWTRQAAEIILANYRTGYTIENRSIFNLLCGVELAKYWAFRGGTHHITADWSFDAVLARHGLASLALTPSKATMLEDIAAQSLQYADGAFDLLRNEAAFERFVSKTRAIRENRVKLTQDSLFFDLDTGEMTIFPHQIGQLGGRFDGEWRLRWCQGFGPFAWQAPKALNPARPPHVSIPVAGPVEFLVSGGSDGGQVQLLDAMAGYDLHPVLMPEAQSGGQVMSLVAPGAAYREVVLTMLSPGTCFHGIRVRHLQPRVQGVTFDWADLPKVENE